MPDPISLPFTHLNELSETKPCCKTFNAIAHKFSWMNIKPEEHENELFCALPHMEYENKIWLVNYCPFCGRNIRGIIIKKHKLDLLRKLAAHSS